MVAHTTNVKTLAAEAGGVPHFMQFDLNSKLVPRQPVIQSKTVFQANMQTHTHKQTNKK